MSQSSSRAPSRSSTPAPSATRSPSRLMIPPALRTASSVSSLRAAASTGMTGPSQSGPVINQTHYHSQSLDSSASSVVDVDINSAEGILVQDVDTEVDTIDGEDGNAIGRMDSAAVDEESKKTLREHLRRTLSKRPSSDKDVRQKPRQNSRGSDLHEIHHEAVSLYPPRQYFVLTDAGKPVFTSRPSDSSDVVTSTAAITQALISVFLDDNLDKLRCINAGRTRITFLLRRPLYLVGVSGWGEPEGVMRTHLEYLHLQILSVVTATQLRRFFERRTNFDLRRLLSGAETFLNSMISRLEFDFALTSGTLHCLKLDATLRSNAADALVPTSKSKDILYVMLVARGRVITVVRPKKHSIHPADIHILINTLNAPSVLNSAASASYIPVCLPKFNPSGFVNAYIAFLRKPEDTSPLADDVPAQEEPSTGHDAESGGVALVCISGSGEFEVIRTWCDSVVARLESEGSLPAISKTLRSGATEYHVNELGIPGLRHFIYKSRAAVQVTMPAFEEPYDDPAELRRLVTLYQILHDAIHAKSGQATQLKLQYIRTERESVLGWITHPFELYVALSPMLPKSAAVNAANAVARWVKKDEGKLFLSNAPVF